MSKQGKNTMKSENQWSKTRVARFVGERSFVTYRSDWSWSWNINKPKNSSPLVGDRVSAAFAVHPFNESGFYFDSSLILPESSTKSVKILDLFLPDSFLLKQRCFCRVFGVCVCVFPLGSRLYIILSVGFLARAHGLRLLTRRSNWRMWSTNDLLHTCFRNLEIYWRLAQTIKARSRRQNIHSSFTAPPSQTSQ